MTGIDRSTGRPMVLTPGVNDLGTVRAGQYNDADFARAVWSCRRPQKGRWVAEARSGDVQEAMKKQNLASSEKPKQESQVRAPSENRDQRRFAR